MKLIVCGGRHFNDALLLRQTLDDLHAKRGFTAMMHGGATGADTLAKEWAAGKPIDRYVCHANWRAYGRAAGPRRNAKMLLWKPDLVVAFPGGMGTADMVKRAKAAGIEVIEVAARPGGLCGVPR